MNHHNHSKNLSFFVSQLLLIVGLITEWLALTSILIENKLPVNDQFTYWVIKLGIVALLVHQYFIITNFHKIDHLTPVELKENGFGDWVIKSRTEDLLRIALFLLFSCLTGEIIYLQVIWEKNMDLVKGDYWDQFGHVKPYNLVWITTFYIKSALVLSIVMIVWDVAGFFYDKKSSIQNTEGREKLLEGSFKNNYLTFIVSDTFGFVFWFAILKVYNRDTDYIEVMKLFLLIYFIVIGFRFILYFKGAPHRFRDRINNYLENTKW